ncbi:MAG: GAF domain-containing protein [Bacteroidota bacterium]
MNKLLNISFYKKYSVQIGIWIILVLIINNFVAALYGRLVLEERNDFISRRIDIDRRLAELDRTVNLMDLGFRGYFMMRKEGFKEPYTRSLEIYGENLDLLKVALGQINYPHLDSIDYIKTAVKSYADLVGRGMQFIESNAPEEAVSLFENDPGYDLWISYNPIQTDVLEFLSEREVISKSKYESVIGYSFFAQLLTLTLSAPILIFVILRLRRNESRMQSLFHNLSQSNQDLIYDDGSTTQGLLQGDKVISRIIDNLRKATDFIKNITNGNLDVHWENEAEIEKNEQNQETLVGELISMRNQMKNMREQEGIRYWIADGISKFSELVRDNQDDLTELTRNLISEIVKYTDSNQGGLFLLNEENPDDKYLEQASTYAYERQKFLNKRLEIGEGIIGQIYLEGETTRLKEIPKNYLNITSGLGHSLPTNLIIVPIKLNEGVEGIMELASFNEYEDHKVELLEKVGEIIASAIINTKTSAQTKNLLQLSRENEEEMKSQEEEMRQNMEELQATQEQEQRTRTELEARIRELESQLEPK